MFARRLSRLSEAYTPNSRDLNFTQLYMVILVFIGYLFEKRKKLISGKEGIFY